MILDFTHLETGEQRMVATALLEDLDDTFGDGRAYSLVADTAFVGEVRHDGLTLPEVARAMKLRSRISPAFVDGYIDADLNMMRFDVQGDSRLRMAAVRARDLAKMFRENRRPAGWLREMGMEFDCDMSAMPDGEVWVLYQTDRKQRFVGPRDLDTLASPIGWREAIAPNASADRFARRLLELSQRRTIQIGDGVNPKLRRRHERGYQEGICEMRRAMAAGPAVLAGDVEKWRESLHRHVMRKVEGDECLR